MKQKRIYPFLAVIVSLFVLWKGGFLAPIFSPFLKEISLLKRPPSPVKVIIEKTTTAANHRSFCAVGTGLAHLSAEIFSPVSEEVTKVYFQAQQKVKKGDILVSLDNREERLAFKLAKVRIKDAKSLLNRYEQAVKDGAVPQSEVDKARADYEEALINLEQAQLNLDDREIKAPFEGIVGIPYIDPGDRIDTQTLITNLDDRSLLYVDLEIPEALTGSLNSSEKRKITAKTPAFPGKIFPGEISALENRIDPNTRTLKVRATLANEEDLLRPGMSFEACLNIEGDDYPTVPEISIQWEKAGSYVWKIEEEHAKKIRVRIISRKEGTVLVEGELQEGDNVVIEGVQRLRDKQNVQVLNTENL